MQNFCDLCGNGFSGRSFKRRNFTMKNFCSISCVESFEIRTGLPNGRVYESRPGWSSHPVVQPERIALPC